MPEPILPKIQGGNLKIHASHFRKVRDRIECTVPLAGQYLQAKQLENGIEISVDENKLKLLQGTSSCNDLTAFEVSVCVDGQPRTLVLLGWPGEEPFLESNCQGLVGNYVPLE